MLIRYAAFLLLGVGLLFAGLWARDYLITPVFFRPGAVQVILAVVLVVGITAFMLRRGEAR